MYEYRRMKDFPLAPTSLICKLGIIRVPWITIKQFDGANYYLRLRTLGISDNTENQRFKIRSYKLGMTNELKYYSFAFTREIIRASRRAGKKWREK